MILDSHLLFSDGQAIASTDASTNLIDLGPFTANTARDIGAGEVLWLTISVNSAFTTGSATTLTPVLQTHSASGFSAQTTLWSGPAISSATLASTGAKVQVQLPVSDSWARYIRLNYTVATGPFTAGSLDAFISKDISMSAKAMGFKQTVSFT